MLVIEKTQDNIPPPKKRGRPPKNSTQKREEGKRGKGIRGNGDKLPPYRDIFKRPANLTYTPADQPEVIQNVLALISKGYSLPEIARRAEMNEDILIHWVNRDKHAVGSAYSRAREARADRVAREVMEIADACPSDTAAVQKARLQTDVRKWWLSHILPEKYGDLQRLEVTGKGGGAIGIQAVGAVAIEDAQRLRALIFGQAPDDSALQPIDDSDEVIDAVAEDG